MVLAEASSGSSRGELSFHNFGDDSAGALGSTQPALQVAAQQLPAEIVGVLWLGQMHGLRWRSAPQVVMVKYGLPDSPFVQKLLSTVVLFNLAR